MGDRRKSGGGGDGAKAPLLPIYLDDHTDPLYATQTLWPADGNASQAAKALHRPASTSVKDPAVQNMAHTAKSLDAAADTFRDTLNRKPGCQMVMLEILSRLQNDPPVLFIDKLKWDLNTPDAFFSLYASRVASDLGLSQKAAMQIEEELKLLAYRARKDLAAGKRKVEQRPVEGSQVRAEPQRRPMLLRGEDARRLIDTYTAKKAAKAGARAAGFLKAPPPVAPVPPPGPPPPPPGIIRLPRAKCFFNVTPGDTPTPITLPNDCALAFPGGGGIIAKAATISDAPVNSSCGDEDAAAALAVHNAAREQAGAPPLEWSPELAAFAQDAVEACRFENTNGPYGENYAFGEPSMTCSRAVVTWTGDRENTVGPGFSTFTQVIWASTQAVGCARGRCGGGDLVACVYDPPGNVLY